MISDLQKANMLKRISAYIFDFILLVTLAVGIAALLSGMLGYDDYTEALKKGNYDIYYAEVRLCADWDLTLLLGAGEALNFGNVRDSRLQELLAAYLLCRDDELPQNARALYEYIGQNGFITPICFEKSEVLYHRGVISGLSPTQDNVFYGMENWTVDLN